MAEDAIGRVRPTLEPLATELAEAIRHPRSLGTLPGFRPCFQTVRGTCMAFEY
ncbi:MAG: hypothetical protein KGJ86_10220 [Chloroflexota bacterium]|nr:hypothetical protein [Chloroflexota bacterium]